MKTIFSTTIISLLLASAIALCYKPTTTPQNVKLSKKDRVDLAMKQEREMTMDPTTKTVPRERLLAAKAYRDGMPRLRSAVAGVSWTSLGPNNQGGRSRAMLIDANDATGKTIFAGSVGGGLWKTTDITAASPNWAPIDDFMGNLAITSIVQDPTTPNTMYLSTGEGYFNFDAIRGLGVWKSTNGGTTWAQLAATNNANFHYCFKMLLATNGDLFVGTRSGLFRSTNGGTRFTKVLDASATGASSDIAYDVEQAANGDIYASLRFSLHKSTNNGATFGAAITLPFASERIEIACAPSNANTVYVLCSAGFDTVSGIAQTTNGGTSWSAKTLPVDADPNFSPTDFSRGQAWYDLTIAVDPNNANTLMVGAIDLFKSTNGAASWTQISHWYGGFGFQYVHADHHNIFYKNGSSSEAYFVNDGGIYRSTDANALAPTLTDKGTNYVTTQFYGCAMHPTASYFLAGSQDNGTHRYNTLTLNNTIEVTGGDGAFCNIDQDQPQFQFTQYVRNQYFKSSDGGASWALGPFNDGIVNKSGRFINPSDYDNTNNKLYAAANVDSFFRWDDPQTGNSYTQVATNLSGAYGSAVTVSPNVNNQVYLGTNTGEVFKISNAHTNTPGNVNISSNLPIGYVSCIQVQNGNENHILVTYSNYGVNSVWETTNGGTSWISVEGNLPDMPIRWIIFHPSDNDKAFVATELGVWSTDNLNGGATNWGSTNSGLANVRVDMIEARPSDHSMIASTHGRGLYYSASLALPQAAFSIADTLIYQGQSVQFTNNSVNATSYLWDFGDGTTSPLQNPNHTYTTGGIFTVSLSINAAVSTVTKTNLIQVLPNMALPYTLAMGGDFESNAFHFAPINISGTAWEKGSSTIAGKSGTRSGSNGYATGLTATNYANNTESYLYTPSFVMMNPGVYTLQFYRKGLLEPDYDGFIVESSIDNGATWLPVGNIVGTNWYDFANPTITSFLAGQAYFNLNKTTFTLSQKDISYLAGNAAVAFRITFKSDNFVTDDGYVIDDFSIQGPPNAPLNVQIFGLKATAIGQHNQVIWHTKHNENVQSYNIERSVDGVQFVQVGNKLSSQHLDNQYSFVDKLLPAEQNQPIHYYRLKVIDKDGQITFSNTVNVVRNTANDVVIFPNPCNDFVNIYAKEPIRNVQLYSLNGKVVALSNQLVNNKLQLPSSLAIGTYFLKVTVGNSFRIQKIMKE